MKRPWLVLVFLCTVLGNLNAQSREPDWLLIEKGRTLFTEREFGDALRIFRSVLDNDQINPEAHFWIGRVFEEEGELDLAEKEYQKALEYRKQLYVLEDEVKIRERLARLYKIRGDYQKFEKALQAIIAMDPDFTSARSKAMQAAMMRVLNQQGLEKVVELYRIDKAQTYLAHAELGLFYYRTGRYLDAVLHLLTAGLTVITRTIDYMKADMPFEEYTSLQQLFTDAQRSDEAAAYLQQSHMAALLYYLGASLYAAGELRPFREMMQLVRGAFPDGQWRSRATSQLADPYIEPVITSENFFYFF